MAGLAEVGKKIREPAKLLREALTF